MSPPHARKPADGTPALSRSNAQIATGTQQPRPTIALDGSTKTYIEGRERILGRPRDLYECAGLTAGELVKDLGPQRAIHWVRSLLSELETAAR
jgi:hypothetical protein